MREIFGQVAFAIAVCVGTIAEVVIAVEANMLALHAHVLTFDPLPALVADVIRHRFVCAVDNSVATVAIVVLVLVRVITNEGSVTFVTESIIVLIIAISGEPNLAIITGVITVRILVVDIIGIFFTRGFLAAYVANYIFVSVSMSNTLQFVAANCAVTHAIFILFNTNVC